MSERLVVDTNVLSCIFNGHSLAQFYKPKLDHIAAVSFQTLAELRLGAALARWGERRTGQLDRFLQAFVVMFPNDALCHRWALVRAESLRAGQPIDAADTWIAAHRLNFGRAEKRVRCAKRSAMTDTITSKNGIAIRISDERWAHITEEDCELTALRTEVANHLPAGAHSCRW